MKKIKELVSSAKSGNKKSFDKLYELTHNDVWYNCLSLLKDEENAKDIMQETYITAFLKLDTLKDEEKFCGWVTTIAVNLCKKKLKGKVEYQIDDEVLIAKTETDELMLPEEYINKAEKRKVLLQIIEDTLSFNQYQVVLMFYFNELSIAEIAQALEISEGTVKSRLNSSRAKMKTAIEDYENKSGDKLHGVVVVPFFTTIFKEEAKSLAVPNITIKLPNGQTLATSATKGIATVSSIVKATATATVKTKVIAVVCGATILAGTSAVGISILAGCNAEKEPTEPSVISSTVQTSTVPTTVPKTTVPKAVKDLVDKGEIKVDKDGNITDKNGKKVEVKDGKVEVKTDDGKTVTVKVDDVKTTVSNKNNSNKGNTEKKEDTKSNTSSKKDNSSKTNTSDNDKKPASKPSNSSSNNQKPASKPSESSKTETTTAKPKQKVWVDDYKTVHHEGYWKVVGTEEEPVYEWVGYNVCNDCGMKLADANSRREHLTWEVRENGGRGSYHYEEEYVQTGTKTVEKKEWVEPYDEKVVSGGHWEYR